LSLSACRLAAALGERGGHFVIPKDSAVHLRARRHSAPGTKGAPKLARLQLGPPARWLGAPKPRLLAAS